MLTIWSYAGNQGALETEEQRLQHKLFDPTKHRVDVLPVLNHSDVINVTFGFELVNIVQVVGFQRIIFCVPEIPKNYFSIMKHSFRPSFITVDSFVPKFM